MDKHLLKMLLFLLFFFSFAAPVAAFWRHLCFGELGTARVDPLMSPGHPSQHAHVSFGSSAFGFNPSIDQLMEPNCTSCSIMQDKSVYWTPRMYFEHSNGTFEMIPTSGGMTAYYFTERPNTGDVITPFPKNFRMIAGNSLKRAFYGPVPDPPMSNWNESDTTQQALMEKSIGFNCLHYVSPPNEGSLAYHYMRSKSFIDSNCPNGVRAEIQFPSCWNGKDLDSENHTTHVAYPTQLRNGQCPEGFPVRLPVLFYETIYTTALFAQLEGQYVFANGDPTGYGYHGDFICGWEDGILQAAINNPFCTNIDPNIQNQGNQDDCPIFKLQDRSVQTTCQMEIPTVLEKEEINIIQQLPGNVQVQAGPDPATIGNTGNAAVSPPSSVNMTSMTASMSNPAVFSANANNMTVLSMFNNSSPCHTPSPTSQIESPSDELLTTTTTFLSNGQEVDIVIVEEIVTTTIIVLPTPVKRHRHKGKRKHSGRLRHG